VDEDEEDADSEETTEVNTERLEQFTQALLAFNASQTTSAKNKASSPADIRSILSQPTKKTVPKKATSNNTQVEVNEVVYNGNTYRLVKE
jgi:regulatory protein YycI of two-component signal transduction system YycFG